MKLRVTALLGLVLWFAGMVGASSGYGQTAPVYAGLDHIEFFVSDLQRSVAFYTTVFGADLWKNRQSERRYLMLGSDYLAFEEQAEPRIDHICYGISNFDIDAVHRYLDREALLWTDYPSGRDLRVQDGDGIRTQLAQDHTWDQLKNTTAMPEPVAQPQTAIFKALLLDEVHLSVTNLEVDALFYARLLGQTGQLQAGSLWFRFGNARLRLTHTPVGQASGVNYFSVLVSNTDLQSAAEAVFAAGGIIENLFADGFSFWDPDGHRIVVHTAPLL